MNQADKNSENGVPFNAGLAVLSGMLLGFSFPPSPLYSIAYVAFIPFLYLFVKLKSYIKITRYSYIFLFVFNIITLYWTGGFVVGKDIWMMMAGGALLLVHPALFLPIVILSYFIKNKFGIVYGLCSFVLFWVSFEYLHSLTEYSFPWITIGNSQSYNLKGIQLLEYISVYGISLIILVFNIMVFLLLWNISNYKWNIRSKHAILTFILLVVIYAGPQIYGQIIMEGVDVESGKIISAGVIQENIDPWEKWGEHADDKWISYIGQLDAHLKETKNLASKKPDIIIWPETAIPFHILMPKYSVYLFKISLLVETINIPVFTGLPTLEYFEISKAPATSQRIGNSNIAVETYNSAVLIEKGGKLGTVHRKTMLVPFAERIPYAETFRFLIEPLKWNVGISSWGKGNDTVINILQLKDGSVTKFSGMICYESVYPDYVKEFVKKGAEFLVIVTNDSWWGNTSGAYQHAAFTSLRAIETRRWIIQCANGGISLIVDPFGRVIKRTGLYTKEEFVGEVIPKKNMTFYVLYGDIAGQICVLLSISILIMAVFKKKVSGQF